MYPAHTFLNRGNHFMNFHETVNLTIPNIHTIHIHTYIIYKPHFQCEIAKNVGPSPSTVNNTVKRFRESEKLSVNKGQGQTPLLNVRDL